METGLTKNYGLIQENIGLNHWILGQQDPLLKKKLNKDWSKFLPVFENQTFQGIQTRACVSFATLNALEILHKAQYNVEINKSDRFLAKVSGTTKLGNTFHNVAMAFGEFGCPQEQDYPFIIVSNDDSWDTYYQKIPEDILEKGKKSLEKYNYYHEWANFRDWKETIKYSPLVVAVNAWYYRYDENNKMEYYNPTGSYNHAVVLFKIDETNEKEYYYIFDSGGEPIKKLPKDYVFGEWGKIFIFNKKTNIMTKRKYEEGVLYKILLNNSQILGFRLDNKLVISETEIDKINIDLDFRARWLKKDVSVLRPVTIRMEDFEEIDIVDLRGDKIMEKTKY